MVASLVRLREEDRDSWNSYVCADPHAYVYHLWEWGDALCKTYNYERLYLAFRRGGEVVGILPLVFIRSCLFGSKIISLPFCEYGGALLKDSSDRSVLGNALSKLCGLARRLKMDYMELRHPSALVSSFLSGMGFRVLRRYLTFRVDLSRGESEELWRRLDKRTRNSLRKAMRSDVEIMDVDAGSVGQYYSLYLDTTRRHGSPPHSYAFFRNLFDAFVPEGRLRMILALYQGLPIAGVMVFCFNERLYWWNNVLDRRYAGLNPTNLLLWRVICWGTENGFNVFDLGRTRPGDMGVYRFKSGWGGREVCLKDYVLFLRNVKIPDPLQRRYVLLSRFWSLMPRTFVAELGPCVVARIGL